ncbi:hypothetical protein NIES592_02070 [Fischerella major NIES-592]|uniref:Uncharacterized protein n=3 Tax=Fischerella TaxID=1190 RepID=A0A1U7H5C1_9CYAN|nr:MULTISPECIES: hypothetical protein [Fischerella]OKH16449.1 hypothetical protein NIES592_02070 [Fischerella major NIES-592]PMB42734.1 hypothetical protein CEN41_14580 [Fischerella thermalis CCMEE 5330]
MSKPLIEDSFDEPEREKETSLPATDADLLNLIQKFSGFETPTKVVLQAIAIASYDCASAFRYADNYLNILKNQKRRKKLLLLESELKFCINPKYVDFRY